MQGGIATAGRKRAAIELVAREDAELRHTARRYSICEDDAEDAYQRALEILLVKAPSDRPRELIRWTKTVVKHEALAIRRNRERMLGAGTDSVGDPVERLATDNAGPGERTEQREQVARTREALLALKPAELKTLTLLGAGYTYAEISAETGYSQTKVNRCLAEGRERFRRLLDRSEDGSRCGDLAPLLSAYCDGQASAEGEAAIREHLRACAGCRATLRAYRAAPAAAAALVPALPVARSLIERAHQFLFGLHSRFTGGAGTGDGGIAQVAAAGGARGAGAAALAKALAICAGTVGGAAACVATGVAPVPFGLAQHTEQAKVEHVAERLLEPAPPETEAERAAVAEPPAPSGAERAAAEPKQPQPEPDEAATETVEAGAVEYAPPVEAAPPAPAPEPSTGSSGGAAGEFGP